MSDNLPFVSVVMPVRNEGAFMAKSLGAVLSQDYPQEKMEVIVADGMSSDETRSVIQDFQKQNTTLILIDNPKKIVAPGLNHAIRQAKGEIIIRVDGHCEIAHDYVRKCVENIINHKVNGVGGPIETIGANELSDIIAIGMSSKFGVGGSAFRTSKEKMMNADTVPFPGYTRKIIEQVGYYDEELVRNQDDEYNYRIRESGGVLLLSPDIKSKYYSRSSFKKLFKQYFEYGFWKVRVLQKHPKQMQPRQFVPALFVGNVIYGAFFSFKWFCFVLIMYFLANAFATHLTCKVNKIRFNPRLSLVFLILHLSYGAGFLVGLIRFSHRWILTK